MDLKATLALLACLVAYTFGCEAASRADTPTTWTLALRFYHGERIVERSYQNDRIDWKLPERRLERFRKGGVIINEEQHVTSEIIANVVSVVPGAAVLQANSTITSLDVPRKQSSVSRQRFISTIVPDNIPVADAPPDIEDAAMAYLPSKPIRLGQRWRTELALTTSLGSGRAVFDHRVVAFDNGLLEIAVRGQGTITGTEYHLPRLLPGTIELHGTAWYDTATGLIAQESYSIHNRIIKPMEGQDSGFDERLSVDTVTHRIL
jgi:hypothetical protein